MIKGFPSQSKLTGQVFNTVTPLGSDKHGIDVAPKAIFPITGTSETPTAVNLIKDVDSGKTRQHITFGAPHLLKEGDVLRFDSGGLTSVEAPIISVPDATSVIIPMILSNILTSTCLFMRHVTLTLDSAGNLSVSSTPIKILLDGVPTEVAKDTVTPANTVAMPVELVSASGIEATFNVTTGDLNIASTHDGVAAAHDSVRIGDGTNLMAVNASLQALVKAADTDAALASLLTELQLKADLTETQPVSAVSLPLPTGAATEATLAAQSAKLPATLGSKADASSLAVTLSTEDKASIASIQSSTADKDVTENYYKRDFLGSPLTVVAGWVTLRTLTSSIKKLIIAQNGGNELLIRNATSGKEVIVGQGIALEIAMLGVATDVIEISALGSDAVDGIIYINFEG